ncbi:hypothetical protein ACQCN2_17160 [Brevibacillus ginsengisoli]|uniref:hypothetical protein n=1 Tax=Brevibacillus ginsengisoli TaxID=363854 RepID=UPI003CF49CE7
MNKQICLLAVGAIFFLLTVILFPRSIHQDEITLSDYFHTDFSGVTRIKIRYGDGNQITVDNPATIRNILHSLKMIRLQKISTQNSPAATGFLYYMDIISNDQTWRYSQYLILSNGTYQSMEPESTQLDKQILQIGREQIPTLLPGLEK